MKSPYQQIIGFFCVIFGLVIVLLSIGSLLIRALIALLGLMLINLGLRLQGSTPLQYRAYHWFNRINYR